MYFQIIDGHAPIQNTTGPKYHNTSALYQCLHTFCRTQACDRCTRRNEKMTCQCVQVAAAALSPCREKYVTRAEYDELKAKFEQMEQNLHLLSAQAGNLPRCYPMFISGGMFGIVPPDNVYSSSPLNHLPQSTGMARHQMMSTTPVQPPQPQWNPGVESLVTAESRHIRHPTQGTMQQQLSISSPVVQTTHDEIGTSSSSCNPTSSKATSADDPPLSLQSKNYQRRHTMGKCLRRTAFYEDPTVRACQSLQSETCLIRVHLMLLRSMWTHVAASSLRWAEM
jgi:hypothetical protein